MEVSGHSAGEWGAKRRYRMPAIKSVLGTGGKLGTLIETEESGHW